MKTESDYELWKRAMRKVLEDRIEEINNQGRTKKGIVESIIHSLNIDNKNITSISRLNYSDLEELERAIHKIVKVNIKDEVENKNGN